MTKNVYSVGQVNQYIKNMFAQDFMIRSICVKGEVSNCKYHTSGHVYFTIKDEQGAMSAVMFAGNRRSGLSFQMKEGDKVLVTGSIEVYEKTGSYQMYAKSIELDGAGNLYLKFEALKKELEEMGMFDAGYKQPIPKYIKRLGIVTAPTGAAVQDIRNIATRRNPFVQLILYPALVQGEGAAESLVNGIHALEQLGVDIIIVGRGGGSIEDLWAFNEEIVARAIFECRTPIISAVGHETDWTIADYVSDMRAPTPSAAAELAVYEYSAVVEQLALKKARMDRMLQEKCRLERERLSHFRTRLIFLSPQNQLNEKRKRLMDMEEKMQDRMEWIIKEKRHQFLLLSSSLEANSPMKKLSQGFAFLEDSKKKTVKSIENVHIEDELTVHLTDGKILAKVSEVIKRE
ncbi:MAG: exodeoxyribonuclease VII large subunit [Agathobacter sp.]